MTVASSTYVAELLKKTGLFQEAQIEDLLNQVRKSSEGITQVVVREGFAGEEDFLEALAKVLNVPFLRLGGIAVDQETLEKLPTKAVFQYNVMPVALDNGALTIAVSDPLKTSLLDTLRLAAGMRVKLALSPSADITKAARAFYGVGAETVDRMMQDDRFELEPEIDVGKLDVSALDQEASIVKFVNQVIWEACQQGATDIHLEPMEDSLRIRYRIDGVLHQTPLPPHLNRFQAAIISRIKVMANLDIAEKRLPMDGRIGLRVQGRDIDIRVSTMPTVYGESVSLRLLQGRGQFISLEQLGMGKRDSEIIQKVIHRPNGIILVTGPTGSGKSTSLYAYLHELNTIDQRILTAEEPIEYEMPGINQVLVRPDIGLTFARILRSFLRQDPDIIMVGEIRDLETAEIAIQASLTGHLVFSTLHTNDALAAIPRLRDLGVESFLLAASLRLVAAQRLVRRLCDACRKPETHDPAFLKQIEFPVAELQGRPIYSPSRCEACRMTGFRGRIGIYEVLQVTDEIVSLIVARSSSNIVKQTSISQGMRTLRDDGWLKVLAGVTTVEEVLRATEENE